MKLLTINTFFESHRGGVELVAGRLAKELAARSLQVTWIASSETPPPEETAVRCIPIRALNITERRLGVPFPIPAPSAFQTIAREVRRSDVVLVHDGLYLTSVAAFLTAAWFRKPLVIIQHIGAIPYRNPLLRGLMRIANRVVARPILARADQVVFISRATADFFSDVQFRRAPHLIFNGVDTDVFKPVDPGEIGVIRRELGLPIIGPIVLFVGRFVERKGLEILRTATGLRPDATWVFAGWGLLDPADWGRPNVVVRQNLSGESLARLYAAADVLVLPSHGEGFPLVIQEALASGLKVICAHECLAADPDASAYLIGVDAGPGDDAAKAKGLCERLDAALVTGSEDRAERRAFAIRRYSWSSAAEDYAGIIRALAKPGRRS
jgi:glycosyltransferase involved in cell wall biosynthesis